MTSRPPAPHDPKKSRIIMRHLPPYLITKPLISYARSHSEYASRSLVPILFILSLTFLLLFTLKIPTARVTATANISQVTPQDCLFNISPGISIISFNCISNSYPLSTVFQDVNKSHIVALWEYEPYSLDSWKVWAPNLPSWVVSDLSLLSKNKGYYILVNSTVLINFSGFLSSVSYVPLVSGPNLAGFPSVVNKSFPDVLTTINSTFRSVIALRNGSWAIYWFNGSGDFDMMVPNEGYWINMSSSDSWLVSRT